MSKLRIHLLLGIIFSFLCASFFPSAFAASGTITELESYFKSHDPRMQNNTPQDYYTLELNKIAANPNNYYFGYAQYTNYVPTDSIDNLWRDNQRYSTAFSFGTLAGDKKSNGKGFRREGFVIVGSNAYIAKNINTSAQTATIWYYGPTSPFSIEHFITNSTARGVTYQTVKVRFSSGSKSRVQRIRNSLSEINSSKWQYYDKAAGANVQDQIALSAIEGDGSNHKNRYTFTLTMKVSSTNFNNLYQIEVYETTGNRGCWYKDGGIEMNYQVKKLPNGEPNPDSAWGTSSGTSRPGILAHPKGVYRDKQPVVSPGFRIGSLGDVGGYININTGIRGILLDPLSKDTNEYSLPHFDFLADGCMTALTQGGAPFRPTIIPKEAVSGGAIAMSEKLDGFARRTAFAPFFAAKNPQDRINALNNLFGAYKFTNWDSEEPTTSDTADDDTDSNDNKSSAENSVFTPSNGGVFTRSLVFDNQQLSDNQLSYSIFKFMYAVARFIVNAAGFFVVFLLFYIPLMWLAHLVSVYTGIDFVRMLIPFKKKLSSDKFSGLDPDFKRKFGKTTLIILFFAAFIISGMMSEIVSIILHYIVSFFTAFTDGSYKPPIDP